MALWLQWTLKTWEKLIHLVPNSENKLKKPCKEITTFPHQYRGNSTLLFSSLCISFSSRVLLQQQDTTLILCEVLWARGTAVKYYKCSELPAWGLETPKKKHIRNFLYCLHMLYVRLTHNVEFIFFKHSSLFKALGGVFLSSLNALFLKLHIYIQLKKMQRKTKVRISFPHNILTCYFTLWKENSLTDHFHG